jgi:hypothetical protein
MHDITHVDAISKVQDIVNTLREREESWAAIGKRFALSRQAAWKRFG